MNTVWILQEHVSYEGSRIIGVYADEGQARAESAACTAANDDLDVSFDVTEYEVTMPATQAPE